MIPPLDTKTNLLPVGCHQCTIKDIKERFVDDFPKSKSRISRFIGYVEYSKFVCENIKSTKKQLCNGSFTTNKLNPHDIDFLFIINNSDLTDIEFKFIKKEKRKNNADKLNRKNMIPFVEQGFVDINELPPCDRFFLIKRDPHDELYNDYIKDKKFWLKQFGNTRPNKMGKKKPKGIINISINSNTFEGI